MSAAPSRVSHTNWTNFVGLPELLPCQGENPGKSGDCTATLYPRAVRRDLQVSLAQVDLATEEREEATPIWRLFTLASDWMAQTVRDLGHTRVTQDQTDNFIADVADVLALLHGAMALVQRGRGNTTPLSNAITLAERALDTLAAMREREEHD